MIGALIPIRALAFLAPVRGTSWTRSGLALAFRITTGLGAAAGLITAIVAGLVAAVFAELEADDHVFETLPEAVAFARSLVERDIAAHRMTPTAVS